MALDILHDNWGPYTHTEVENALKAYLTVLENCINQAIQSGGVGLADLSAEVQALLNKANTALQPENIAAWAKAQNKPGYTADEITGITGFQNLLAKLQDMDAKIQAAAASGGVDPDDEMSSTSENVVQNKVIKAYVDAAVLTLQNALNALMNGQSVTDAIDTFNEVKAFLEGIDTDDPTLFNQLKSLSDAITALQNTLNSKANDADVVKGVSVNGTAQSKDTNGNVNVVVPTLTFDDAPTAGSNNAVKSGGIKTALDAKANAADVPTKTEVSDAIDDALGEAQVTVVPAGSVGVIASLGSDSDEDALSASMGKKLKVAVLTILNSLGNYAFPNGKPTIDWGGDSSVTYSVTYPDASVTKVTHGNAPATVNLGDQLEVMLGTNDDLYVVKDSSVKVYMGGVEQSGAYDSATQKVTLAAVTGNVVIVADSMTYVQDGLVLHLDCRHRGGTGTEVSGHWKSLVNYGQTPIDFTLKSGVTAADTGMVFDGGVNSYGEADTLLNILYSQATIECVASGISSQFNTVLVNPVTKGIGLSVHTVSAYSHMTAVMAMADSFTGQSAINSGFLTGDSVTDYAMSVNNERGYNKGVAISSVLSANGNVPYLTLDMSTQTKLTLGARFRGSGNNMLNGTIRSIRVYNSVLTADQQLQNWIVDKKRFNL